MRVEPVLRTKFFYVDIQKKKEEGNAKKCSPSLLLGRKFNKGGEEEEGKIKGRVYSREGGGKEIKIPPHRRAIIGTFQFTLFPRLVPPSFFLRGVRASSFHSREKMAKKE